MVLVYLANSNSSAAPMPQPRTKPRDTTPSPIPPSSSTSIAPQPKPRPRPDRKVVTEPPPPFIPEEPSIVLTPEVEVTVTPRNSMTRIGVKVFPDNALQDRAAARLSSSHLRDRPSLPTRPQSMHVKPNVTTAKLLPSMGTHQQQQPMQASLFPPTYTGTGSVRSLKSLNDDSSPSSQNPTGPDSDTDSDSLDVDMQLFEAKKKHSSKKRAPIPTSISRSDQSSSSTTNAITRAASDSNILLEGMNDVGNDELEVASAIVKIESANNPTAKKRISSTGESYPKLKPSPKGRIDMSQQKMNRWGNTESLHATDDNSKSATGASTTKPLGSIPMRLSSSSRPSPSIPPKTLTTKTTKSTINNSLPLKTKTLNSSSTKKTEPPMTTKTKSRETSSDNDSGAVNRLLY